MGPQQAQEQQTIQGLRNDSLEPKYTVRVPRHCFVQARPYSGLVSAWLSAQSPYIVN